MLRDIDIYSRVDGALAGLLARHLKSCDSVDYRLAAVSETRVGSDWSQPEVNSAASEKPTCEF
jgi:hypothetical protein